MKKSKDDNSDINTDEFDQLIDNFNAEQSSPQDRIDKLIQQINKEKKDSNNTSWFIILDEIYLKTTLLKEINFSKNKLDYVLNIFESIIEKISVSHNIDLSELPEILKKLNEIEQLYNNTLNKNSKKIQQMSRYILTEKIYCLHRHLELPLKADISLIQKALITNVKNHTGVNLLKKLENHSIFTNHRLAYEELLQKEQTLKQQLFFNKPLEEYKKQNINLDTLHFPVQTKLDADQEMYVYCPKNINCSESDIAQYLISEKSENMEIFADKTEAVNKLKNQKGFLYSIYSKPRFILECWPVKDYYTIITAFYFNEDGKPDNINAGTIAKKALEIYLAKNNFVATEEYSRYLQFYLDFRSWIDSPAYSKWLETVLNFDDEEEEEILVSQIANTSVTNDTAPSPAAENPSVKQEESNFTPPKPSSTLPPEINPLVIYITGIVIGAIIGALTGFIIGALAGAAIGSALGIASFGSITAVLIGALTGSMKSATIGAVIGTTVSTITDAYIGFKTASKIAPIIAPKVAFFVDKYMSPVDEDLIQKNNLNS